MLIKFNAARTLMLEVTTGAPQLRILPQVNEIPDDVWNKIRGMLSDKLVAAKGQTKALIEELHVTTKAGAKAASGKLFKELSSGEAEGLVKETLDVELLKRWKGEDLRDVVRLAIANQLEELSTRNKSAKASEA